jgi:23S rRNA pseudouridine955/2504/2580 synthase
MSNFIKQNVTYHLIDEGSVGQKIDNFLIKHLKSIPKSHIYKLLRSGQVRVNKKRIKTDFKLSQGDNVRIPPVNLQPTKPKLPLLISKDLANIILKNILYEDDYVLVINKPSGIAVHGGSGLNFGVIELIRALRPKYRFLELIHRIDKETSGILLIAKKRSALVNVHQQMREKRIHKKYQVAVNGLWTDKQKIVDLELLKTTAADGQKIVRVLEGNYKNVLSKDSRSVFFLKKNFGK